MRNRVSGLLAALAIGVGVLLFHAGRQAEPEFAPEAGVPVPANKAADSREPERTATRRIVPDRAPFKASCDGIRGDESDEGWIRRWQGFLYKLELVPSLIPLASEGAELAVIAGRSEPQINLAVRMTTRGDQPEFPPSEISWEIESSQAPEEAERIKLVKIEGPVRTLHECQVGGRNVVEVSDNYRFSVDTSRLRSLRQATPPMLAHLRYLDMATTVEFTVIPQVQVQRMSARAEGEAVTVEGLVQVVDGLRALSIGIRTADGSVFSAGRIDGDRLRPEVMSIDDRYGVEGGAFGPVYATVAIPAGTSLKGAVALITAVDGKHRVHEGERSFSTE
jgi:hypothetical protein